MAVETFANAPIPSIPSTPWTTLAAGIDASVTSLTVVSAAAFPSAAKYRILIDNEWMLVTAGGGTTTWTVTRGVEGSTAAVHASGAQVFHMLTAGALEVLPRSMTTAGDTEYLGASGAPTRLASPGDGNYVTTWTGGVPSWVAGVVGPASAVDNAIARFDGTTGKIVQDYTSGAPTIGDTGVVMIGGAAGVATLDVIGTFALNAGTFFSTVDSTAQFVLSGTTAPCYFNLNPDALVILRGNIAATGGATAKRSPELRFMGHRWTGSASTTIAATANLRPNATIDNSYLAFGFSDNNDQMLVLTHGTRVGIGTTSPASALEVVGSVTISGYQQLTEMTAPSAGAANTVRFFIEDNGSGKTRLMAIFASGVSQQIAIEP